MRRLYAVYVYIYKMIGGARFLVFSALITERILYRDDMQTVWHQNTDLEVEDGFAFSFSCDGQIHSPEVLYCLRAYLGAPNSDYYTKHS